MTDCIGVIYAKNEIKLLWLIVLFHISLVYFEIETKPLGHIWLSAIYDENQTRQRHDPLYRCNLHQKG